MKRVVTIAVITVSCVPMLAGAIVVNTSASSHTGGVTTGTGDTVVTDSSSASVEVKTIIRSGTEGGTADVQVSTTQNGVTHTETEQYRVLQNGSTEIRAATSAKTTRSMKKTGVILPVSTTSTVLPDRASSTGGVIPAIPQPLIAWLNQAPQSIVSFVARTVSALWW